MVVPSAAVVPPSAARPADIGRSATHGITLVEQQARGHGPAVVDLPDHILDRYGDVVEEFLTELVRTVRHLDLLDVDAGLVDLQDEHGEPAVLRRMPVGAGQTQGVVTAERARAPDLRAVQNEDVAVAGGPGDQAGQVRTSRRLGEELHPNLFTRDHLGQMGVVLLLGAEVEKGRSEDGERGDVQR